MTATHGVTLFCEGIRDEQNEQKTLVGVYTGDLVVQGGFPVVLPTLAIYITLVEPWQEAKGPLNLKVLVPGENGDEVVSDTNLAHDRRDDAGGGTAKPECLYSMLSFRLSPLLIQQGGHIRVRAYKGDHEIKLGSLLVTDSNT